MSDAYFVDHTEFEPLRLLLGSVQSKTSKAQGTPGTKEFKPPAAYQQADFQYLYKLANGSEVKDSFCIQLCGVKCRGISEPSPGFSNWQIMALYDKTVPEVVACLKTLDLVHARMVDLIVENRAALKANNVDVDMAPMIKAKGKIFKKLVHAEDKVTGEFDPNKNPTQYYKLQNYKDDKTKFMIWNPSINAIQVVEWTTMMKAEYTGKPLIKYTHLYCNGNNISPQHAMLSMALESFVERGTESAQKDTLMKMAQTMDPDKLKAASTNLSNVLDKLANMGSNAGSKPGSLDKQEKKSEPLTSTPTDLTSFMKNNSNQPYSGSINPNNNTNLNRGRLANNRLIIWLIYLN
jgi:hypothetical protein